DGLVTFQHFNREHGLVKCRLLGIGFRPRSLCQLVSDSPDFGSRNTFWFEASTSVSMTCCNVRCHQRWTRRQN
ncbi:hypothetical protein RB213_004140, partial [Colletotrichum asianum]